MEIELTGENLEIYKRVSQAKAQRGEKTGPTPGRASEPVELYNALGQRQPKL